MSEVNDIHNEQPSQVDIVLADGALQVTLPKLSGVYFLCVGGCVMYVGQTGNLTARVHSHSSRWEFDSILFLPCGEWARSGSGTVWLKKWRSKGKSPLPQQWRGWRVDVGVGTGIMR